MEREGWKRSKTISFTPDVPPIKGYLKGKRVTFTSTNLGVVQRDAEHKPTFLAPGQEVTFRLIRRGKIRAKLTVDTLPPMVDPLLEPML